MQRLQPGNLGFDPAGLAFLCVVIERCGLHRIKLRDLGGGRLRGGCAGSRLRDLLGGWLARERLAEGFEKQTAGVPGNTGKGAAKKDCQCQAH
jgi:hypothetical protein